MRTLLLWLILTISPILTFGHNPLSARYHLEANDKVSLLTISLSQDGVNQALLAANKLTTLSHLNRIELEEMIVAYVKRNFNLTLDGSRIKLEEGGIKLGSHQTDLKFILPPVSIHADKLEIDIPAFKENDYHQTIFSYQINGRSEHIILSSDNEYQSTLWLNIAPAQNGTMWYLFGGLCLFTFLVVFIKGAYAKKVSAPIYG